MLQPEPCGRRSSVALAPFASAQKDVGVRPCAGRSSVRRRFNAPATRGVSQPAGLQPDGPRSLLRGRRRQRRLAHDGRRPELGEPHRSHGDDRDRRLGVGSVEREHRGTPVTGEANYANHSRYGLGLFKSIDGGDNWVHIAQADFSGRCFARIAVDPSDGQRCVRGDYARRRLPRTRRRQEPPPGRGPGRVSTARSMAVRAGHGSRDSPTCRRPI